MTKQRQKLEISRTNIETSKTKSTIVHDLAVSLLISLEELELCNLVLNECERQRQRNEDEASNNSSALEECDKRGEGSDVTTIEGIEPKGKCTLEIGDSSEKSKDQYEIQAELLTSTLDFTIRPCCGDGNDRDGRKGEDLCLFIARHLFHSMNLVQSCSSSSPFSVPISPPLVSSWEEVVQWCDQKNIFSPSLSFLAPVHVLPLSSKMQLVVRLEILLSLASEVERQHLELQLEKEKVREKEKIKKKDTPELKSEDATDDMGLFLHDLLRIPLPHNQNNYNNHDKEEYHNKKEDFKKGLDKLLIRHFSSTTCQQLTSEKLQMIHDWDEKLRTNYEMRRAHSLARYDLIVSSFLHSVKGRGNECSSIAIDLPAAETDTDNCEKAIRDIENKFRDRKGLIIGNVGDGDIRQTFLRPTTISLVASSRSPSQRMERPLTRQHQQQNNSKGNQNSQKEKDMGGRLLENERLPIMPKWREERRKPEQQKGRNLKLHQQQRESHQPQQQQQQQHESQQGKQQEHHQQEEKEKFLQQPQQYKEQKRKGFQKGNKLDQQQQKNQKDKIQEQQKKTHTENENDGEIRHKFKKKQQQQQQQQQQQYRCQEQQEDRGKFQQQEQQQESQNQKGVQKGNKVKQKGYHRKDKIQEQQEKIHTDNENHGEIRHRLKKQQQQQQQQYHCQQQQDYREKFQQQSQQYEQQKQKGVQKGNKLKQQQQKVCHQKGKNEKEQKKAHKQNENHRATNNQLKETAAVATSSLPTTTAIRDEREIPTAKATRTKRRSKMKELETTTTRQLS